MSGMDYSQFEELVKSYKDLAKDYDNFLNDFITKEGMRCLANTKRRTPVDTGTLRNRWKLHGPYKKGNTRYVVIGNNLKYASFVEDGHMQYARFIPLTHLAVTGNGNKIISAMRAKYGSNVKGIKLKRKWIKGHHMARIALTQTQQKLPQRFERAFKDYCKGKGLE